MKITTAIDRHFKRNLGDDYLAFYTDWILWLAVPIAATALIIVAIHWMKGGVS